VRPATALRIGVGAACLGAPQKVVSAIGGLDRRDRSTLVVARLLGARMVAQAALDLAAGRRVLALGVAVDLAHAASMVPVVALWPLHRRTAAVSAAAATATALLDLRDA
jgi:hypothetical protein